MPSLRNSLTSSYLEAAHRLYPKQARRRIVAYVESYEDVAFWRTLLGAYENESCYFQVMLPSNTSLSKGKKMVLLNTLNTAELGRSLIACVDSDYDFLLQETTATSRRMNRNPYIFQTYAYAIENFHCYAEGLHEVCVQATLNDRVLIDFPAFLRRYSQTIYPLFLWNIWFYRRGDTNTFPMHAFNEYVGLPGVSLRHPERALGQVERAVRAKLGELRRRFAGHLQEVEELGEALTRQGLTPEVTYLYMQGHHLMEGVVLKLLTPVCIALRREREQEIKQLARHGRQFRNELTAYNNSIVPLSLALRKQVTYQGLYLYGWMKRDVEQFLTSIHQTI
ncbi:MAG: DUF4435 domain-containing protein [Prevotellaceae bacterium]|jgi:hypothetical protein|nr:DUF4435 domain-containing protein [Prevotellaceae bacterium]